VPHLPDDEGYLPPVKVLRKRLNGVYREDHGLSGPTRRYLLLVALLVGLASVPTLAVITAGTSEISGDRRNGAMDAPFLPPPATGPVHPTPTPKNHSRYDDEPRPPSHSGTPTTKSPGVSPPDRTRGRLPVVPGLPSVPDDPGTGAAPTPRAPSDVDHRRSSPDGGVSRQVTAFPTVPGLPSVPDDDRPGSLGRRAPSLADDIGNSPEFPDVPDSPAPAEPSAKDDSSSDNPDSSDDADSSDASAPDDLPDDSASADDDSDDTDADDTDADDVDADDVDSGDADDEDPDDDDSPHHECEAAFRPTTTDDRRRSRSRSSRRSAVTERPNVNAARVLAYSYTDGRNVRRSMIQSRTDENRITNRPYRGHHRAEHTLHDENAPARRRSSRVGRHHADPASDEHHVNHR
jgi:hypothetical protein